jgi:ABC-type transport system substrate-binding protein
LRKAPRSAKALTAAVGMALIVAACGSSAKQSSNTTSGGGTTAASAPTETSAPGTTASSGPKAPMTLTIKIKKEAVWDDGTPVNVKDFQCLLDATLNTPGSLSTVGYDEIDSISAGADDHEVIVKFKTVYAPYRNLFSTLLEAAKVTNCSDVSADFQDNIPFSAREWKIDSWSKDQLILVPNTAFWDKARTPKAAKVVMVPKADSDTEINSLKSGETDFIFPQAFAGIADALKDPNIKFTPGYGTNYEVWAFQQKTGPFADADFRKGFAHSVDRDLILKSIYDPIFPGSPLLDCGVWVPTIGKWCDNTVFKDYYNPTMADDIMTKAGWAKDGAGFWAKDGTVPEIRWIINTGNKRREDTQALMIPELAKHGFKVKADNCDAACYFQQRLPALDYDLAMYINTASPDPTVTGVMSCSQVPGPENDNKGQNNYGWCNETASDLMAQSDQTVDLAKREDLIHQIAHLLGDDAVMLSLFQFPNIAAWRTDKLSGGPIDADASNYRAFGNSMYTWVPKGDQITIGAEQWPDCLNPITECANSSWYVWTTAFNVLPNVWDTTADGEYIPTDMVEAEPTVELG